MDTNERLAWHVSLAGRALSARIQRRFAEYGLGHGEYRVLFALYEEEGLTQTDIVEDHHLDKSVVARVTSRLEEKDYVERRPDPEDRRRKRLFLTPSAEEIRPAVESIKEEVNAEVTRGLDEREVESLVAGLRTVAGNLGAELEDE
ncbi:MarR family winged helix-turn-helix transcriptional regulator [Halalkalicoccus subterraneus]|uniref:MarR family winged helix-turn-helix transcriptional regulator n=1 Tax=Halalkalicoccus subterraneus TaxID=2675002 RepID=UPI000EFBF56C|nr:MarR family transcriptional regulator [Halalkalicoccus subterraneus]